MNYIKKVMEDFKAGKFPPGDGAVYADVCHDDGCPKLDGGECNCNPTITYSSEPPDETA